MYFVVIIRHAKCILASKFQPADSNRHELLRFNVCVFSGNTRHANSICLRQITVRSYMACLDVPQFRNYYTNGKTVGRKMYLKRDVCYNFLHNFYMEIFSFQK